MNFRTQTFKTMAALLLGIGIAQFSWAQEKNVQMPVDMSRLDKKLGDLKPLNKQKTVWIDLKKKIVVVAGKVELRQGQLEMFACTPGTKEHESIVSIGCKAFEIHSGMLAIGAKKGKPVSYDPKYVPATGDEIEISAHWIDKKGKLQQADAKSWIRNTKTKKDMKIPWVFAGSSFYKDERTGKEYYMAEGGEVVCLSNFTTAMIDVSAESSAVNSGLLFEANTDRIPPKKTPVRLVIKIKEKKKDAADKKDKKTDVPSDKTDDSTDKQN